MNENNSKYPKFFVIMELILSMIILVGMFFSFMLVAGAYFIALILFVVFLILDKRYGQSIINYKQSFFLFDFINLIGVVAVLYYEFSRFSKVLSTLLILILMVKLFAMLVDVFVIKNQNFSNNEYVLANVVQLCSMICMLTYFLNVSELFFAVDALLFELACLILKFYINRENKEKVEEKKVEDSSLEDRIRSAGKDEGDVEWWFLKLYA